MDEQSLRDLLERLSTVDPTVIFHEPFNVRSARMEATVDAATNSDNSSLEDALERLTHRKEWMNYAVRQTRTVQELGVKLDLPIHICPHWQLVRAADGQIREWFEAWRVRQPPERFAGRPQPDGKPPIPPADR